MIRRNVEPTPLSVLLVISLVISAGALFLIWWGVSDVARMVAGLVS